MVGIGTSDVNLDKYRHTFCSLLGKDEDSWGLSYTGNRDRVAAWAAMALEVPSDLGIPSVRTPEQLLAAHSPQFISPGPLFAEPLDPVWDPAGHQGAAVTSPLWGLCASPCTLELYNLNFPLFSHSGMGGQGSGNARMFLALSGAVPAAWELGWIPGVQVFHRMPFFGCVYRTAASQGRQNKLLLEVWPRLHYWGAFGHVARDTHILQEPQVHR